MASLWARIGNATKGHRSDLRRSVKTLTFWAMIGLPSFAWLKEHVAVITVVNGASMHPYLNGDKDATASRDVVFSNHWAAKENLKRGMIVTMRSPHHPEIVAIKRIIGMEGDTIQTREPYETPSVKIPPGHLWVEGDGRSGTTLDSNTYGPVSVQMVTGKVTHIVFPFHKFGRIKWWEHDVPIGPGKR